MSKKNDRIVFKTTDGDWANKKNSADKACSLHNTQKEAEDAARQMLKNQGGGELITKGLDGKIRSKIQLPPVMIQTRRVIKSINHHLGKAHTGVTLIIFLNVCRMQLMRQSFQKVYPPEFPLRNVGGQRGKTPA